MLRLSGVKRSFSTGSERLEVLRGIDLSVEEGEIVAVVGPSGVGKSTLLHIMGALDEPTEGKVYLRDTDVFAMTEIDRAAFRNRTVGFVFQFHHLLRELTALENVMMPCLIGGMQKDAAAARAEKLLAAVSLSHRAHHRPGELSG
ncbi:MAG: ATP-binding cassette domain-containing protein, partial [Candidatus Eisenbacteria bacterium]|nr:ATP-binding cassette domain-containing protein [Candidatus Eisenbacteria bacterium]